MPRHIGIGHAERIDAHLNLRLAEDQRGGDILENLINPGIGHGVAAY